jgi:DNA-binding NarL/FixJ family response regulator
VTIVATSVVLADDGALFRQVLADALERAGFRVRAQVGAARQLAAAVGRHAPDVVVVNVRIGGFEAAAEVRRAHPGTGILLLSHQVEPGHVKALLDYGEHGIGYLLRERVAGLGGFLAALRRVAAGGFAFDDEIVARLMYLRHHADPLDTLTERETEILALMAAGRSNQGICRQLSLTKKTVETHIRNILLRLDLPPEPDDHRRVRAVLTYLDRWQEHVPAPT